jgi:hypothetical protein
MAAAAHGGPDSDLYQLLGVSRDASREEIAQAWRRRARAEHPDSRPRDTAAAGRFRALAEAYQVLSDPARRAAYDRALAHRQLPGTAAAAPAARVPVRHRGRPGRPRGAVPLTRPAAPPLRAGPVLVEGTHPGPAAGGWHEPDIRLTVLAELALRYLARDQDWPW